MTVFDTFSEKTHGSGFCYEFHAGRSSLIEEYVKNAYEKYEELAPIILSSSFLLPWYSYTIEDETKINRAGEEIPSGSKEPPKYSISMISGDENGDNIFPPMEYIIEFAEKEGLTHFSKDTEEEKAISVFAKNDEEKEQWENFLILILKEVLFNSSGMYIRNMHEYFWISVINWLRDNEQALDLLKERRDLCMGGGGVITGNLVDRVIKRIEKANSKEL